MKNKGSIAAAGMLLLLLALASPALAQDEAAPAETAETAPAETQETAPEETAAADTENAATVEEAITTAAADEAVDAVIEEAGLSAEAIEDETVTEEDLGAETPGRFHFLKKLTRTVQRVVTRDPVKKAEYRIEEAHEELLRAQKLTEENPDDEKAQKKIEKALDKFESNIEKVKEHAADIKEKRADQAGDFLEKIADFQMKQQKVLDKLEEKLPEAVFAKVQEARQRTIANQSEVMTRVAENAEQITERFSAALQNQRGSDFREFKNMEVLQRVSEFIPEEARAAIEQVQAAARTRFEEHIQSLPEEIRNESFGRYMANITGDPVTQMRTLDNIKSQANLPDDFFAQIERAKEQTVSKFEERFRRFEDPAQREAFMATFDNGSVDNLRVIQQFKESVPEEIKQEIQQKEQQSIQRFKERFTDDPDAQSRANKFQELAQKMRQNPDSATFAAIQQLEETLPADQRQFVQNLRSEASQGFVQHFQEGGDTFFKRIQSFDPAAIQHFQQIQSDSGGAAQVLLNRAVSQQIDFVRERIQQIDDPARFERIKMQFEQNPEIQRQIQARFADFGSQLQNKEQEINVIKEHIEQGFNARIDQERQVRQEQGLPDFSEQELGNLKERNLLRPQLQAGQELQNQFRRFEEEKMQREQQGTFTEQRPEAFFQQFENTNPEIKQKLEQQFKSREQEFRQQIEQGGFIPQEVQQKIQQQQQFQNFQGGDRGQPSQTGQEQRVDPRQFQPTERGEFRSDEVRQEQRSEIKTENGRTEIRNEFEQKGNEVRTRQEIRTDSGNNTFQPQQNFREPNQQQGQQQPQQQQQNFREPSSGGGFNQPQGGFTQPQGFQQPAGEFKPQDGGGSFTPPPSSSGPSSGGGGSFSPPPSDGGGSGSFSPPPSGDGSGSFSPPPQ